MGVGGISAAGTPSPPSALRGIHLDSGVFPVWDNSGEGFSCSNCGQPGTLVRVCSVTDSCAFAGTIHGSLLRPGSLRNEAGSKKHYSFQIVEEKLNGP